jgi:cytochrome P450
MASSSSKCPFHNTSSIHEFDALNEEARANPWPFYDWLRASDNRTVYKLPQEKSFYVVHRYDDVNKVLTDTTNFSSKIIPTKKSLFFVLMDGEDHKRIRTIISELLSLKNKLLQEIKISEVVTHANSRIINTGSVELFREWADKIPLKVLALLFGMNTSDKAIAQMHTDAIAINRALFVTGGTGARRKNAPTVKEKIFITAALIVNSVKIVKLFNLVGFSGMRELKHMLRPEKKNQDIPRPDFNAIPVAISPMLNLMVHFATELKRTNKSEQSNLQLMQHAIETKNASIMEMVMAGAFILFAGYETTSSLLSNAVVHLANNPETFRQLKKNPEHIEDFIEECLRFYTPVGRFLRKTNADVELDGKIIPKNSMVLVLTGAANTDPEKFSNGCIFDYERSNSKQNLSFGKGAHYCIGAPLARLQILTALKSLIDGAERIELDDKKQLKMVVDRDNGILRYEEVWLTIKSNC